MTGGWSQYVESSSHRRQRMHYFPNSKPGEDSVCARAQLTLTKHKSLFSDPKTWQQKKICKACQREIESFEYLHKGEKIQELPQQSWGKIILKWTSESVFHFFIKDCTTSLCGSQKPSYSERLEITFISNNDKVDNKCKNCEKQIDHFLEFGKTKSEIADEKYHRSFTTYIPPTIGAKPFKTSKDPLVWSSPTIRCDHVDKNGKRCNFVGGYPTGDLQKSIDNPHFCQSHNLKIKLFLSQSKREIAA